MDLKTAQPLQGDSLLFYRYVPRDSWYSFDRHRKDEGLSRTWNHPVVMNPAPLDWQSSAQTTRPLFHK